MGTKVLSEDLKSRLDVAFMSHLPVPSVRGPITKGGRRSSISDVAMNIASGRRKSVVQLAGVLSQKLADAASASAAASMAVSANASMISTTQYQSGQASQHDNAFDGSIAELGPPGFRSLPGSLAAQSMPGSPAAAQVPRPAPSASPQKQSGRSNRTRMGDKCAAVVKHFGYLLEQDIHKLCQETGYDRNQLYTLFTQFKGLCALSTEKTGGAGIDRETFRRYIPTLACEDDQFAKRAFDLLDADGGFNWQGERRRHVCG